jgi:hypothetical protein
MLVAVVLIAIVRRGELGAFEVVLGVVMTGLY